MGCVGDRGRDYGWPCGSVGGMGEFRVSSELCAQCQGEGRRREREKKKEPFLFSASGPQGSIRLQYIIMASWTQLLGHVHMCVYSGAFFRPVLPSGAPCDQSHSQPLDDMREKIENHTLLGVKRGS